MYYNYYFLPELITPLLALLTRSAETARDAKTSVQGHSLWSSV